MSVTCDLRKRHKHEVLMTSPIHQYSGQPNRPELIRNAGVLTRRHARKVIAASTRIGRTALSTVSGHSIYHAERPKADGGGSEVAEFEIPWVCDTFEAESAIVEFSFRGITLTPYLAQAVVEPGPNDYRGVGVGYWDLVLATSNRSADDGK
jgi:hypothetical protein